MCGRYASMRMSIHMHKPFYLPQMYKCTYVHAREHLRLHTPHPTHMPSSVHTRVLTHTHTHAGAHSDIIAIATIHGRGDGYDYALKRRVRLEIMKVDVIIEAAKMTGFLSRHVFRRSGHVTNCTQIVCML